jgi:hypothetical protein
LVWLIHSNTEARRTDQHELQAKYRTIKISNFRKGKGKHDKKYMVDVIRKCGKKQTVATSDLWLKNCCDCGEKLNRKKGAK